MPFVLPFTALFTALGLEITAWGQGRFNWGPRAGALFLLVVGQVAFAGTVLGTWLRDGIDVAAAWVGQWTAYLMGAAAGDAIAYLIHWLPAALLGAYWLAAWVPKLFSERMTWRLAWAGVFLPTFITAIPGPAGHFLGWAFGLFTALGAWIIGSLFAMATHVRGGA